MVKQDKQLDFAAVFNSLPGPWLVMDRDFTIVALNRAFLDVTMRSRDEIIGLQLFTAYPSTGESRRIVQASL
ncbi:MAG: PAS domain-containing protein, partial [Beijerinckiaceae bacterium]